MKPIDDIRKAAVENLALNKRGTDYIRAQLTIVSLCAALEKAIIIVDKYAGPKGCGCEVGSMKHQFQICREEIEKILKGDE